MYRKHELYDREGYAGAEYFKIDRKALKALQKTLETGDPTFWNEFRRNYDKKHPPGKDGRRRMINLESVDLHVLIEKPEGERNHFYTASGKTEGNPNSQTKFFTEDFGSDLPANCRAERYAPLVSLDFSNVNFRKANLSGTTLMYSNFGGAYLGEVHLVETDLSNANLSNANLEKAFLPGATLQGATLQGATLTGAGLMDTNLQLADLEAANLKGAFLHGADLSGAYLINSSLGVHPMIEGVKGTENMGGGLKLNLGGEARQIVDIQTLEGSVNRIAKRMTSPQLPPPSNEPVALDTPDGRSSAKNPNGPKM